MSARFQFVTTTAIVMLTVALFCAGLLVGRASGPTPKPEVFVVHPEDISTTTTGAP